MNVFFLISLLLPLTFCLDSIDEMAHLATDLEALTKKEMEILSKLDVEIQDFKLLLTPEAKLRSRRKIICGRKLTMDVNRVCGGFDRNLPTDIDLSTTCCHKACSDEIIMKAMCPDKLT